MPLVRSAARKPPGLAGKRDSGRCPGHVDSGYSGPPLRILRQQTGAKHVRDLPPISNPRQPNRQALRRFQQNPPGGVKNADSVEKKFNWSPVAPNHPDGFLVRDHIEGFSHGKLQFSAVQHTNFLEGVGPSNSNEPSRTRPRVIRHSRRIQDRGFLVI